MESAAAVEGEEMVLSTSDEKTISKGAWKLLKSNQFEEASRAFTSSLSQSTDLLLSCDGFVGRSLSKSGQLLFDDAIVDAKIALHLDPLSLKAQYSLLKAIFGKKEYAQVVNLYTTFESSSKDAKLKHLHDRAVALLAGEKEFDESDLKILAHDHSHGHCHGHEHNHGHDHSHEHGHGHSHEHGHEHGPQHGHDHEHSHSHNHEHNHSHGGDHDQEHSHDHEHGKPGQSGCSHGHEHAIEHEHRHDHS